jgi:integrase
MLDLAAAKASPSPSEAPKHRYGAMRASELLAEFLKAKGADWSEATKVQIPRMCGTFVELMADPALSDIDGVMFLRYRERLQTLPTGLNHVKRRFKVESLAELIALVGPNKLPTISDKRAGEYIAKVSELIEWGKRKGFISDNPAAGASERRKKVRREQDERLELTDASLNLIFSAEWFQTGKGEKTANGTYRTFQPFYYWLPLLALYTGGRLNEISQLRTADIGRTEAGLGFLTSMMMRLKTADLTSD